MTKLHESIFCCYSCLNKWEINGHSYSYPDGPICSICEKRPEDGFDGVAVQAVLVKRKCDGQPAGVKNACKNDRKDYSEANQEGSERD